MPKRTSNRPSNIGGVETQDDPRCTVRPPYQAMLAMISPQTSTKLVGDCGTTVDHVLAMAFDDPSMDDDLCQVLDAHEVHEE